METREELAAQFEAAGGDEKFDVGADDGKVRRGGGLKRKRDAEIEVWADETASLAGGGEVEVESFANTPLYVPLEREGEGGDGDGDWLEQEVL